MPVPTSVTSAFTTEDIDDEVPMESDETALIPPCKYLKKLCCFFFAKV